MVAVFMAPGLMLPSKPVFGRTRVVLGLLRRFLSVYVVIRVECLFVYYVVSMCMHFFLITPSPCVRAAPHVTASGEAPRSGSGGSRSLGDLPNHPSPTHLMSDLRGRLCARHLLALLAPSPLEPRATGRLKLPGVFVGHRTSW